MSDVKENGDKRDIRTGDKANKLRLTESIAIYDRMSKGVITKKQL